MIIQTALHVGNDGFEILPKSQYRQFFEEFLFRDYFAKPENGKVLTEEEKEAKKKMDVNPVVSIPFFVSRDKIPQFHLNFRSPSLQPLRGLGKWGSYSSFGTKMVLSTMIVKKSVKEDKAFELFLEVSKYLATGVTSIPSVLMKEFMDELTAQQAVGVLAGV